jgi:hypothetical protein
MTSTMSFTIDMHYCGDTLVATAIFQKAKTCGMEQEKQSIKDFSVTKKSCCSDKQLVIDGQDELQLSVDTISFEQQVFITSFVYTYSTLFEGLNNVSSFEEYEPPLVIKEIFKIDETYLI